LYKTGKHHQLRVLRRLPGPRLLLAWGLDHRSGGVLGEEHGHGVAEESLFAADIDEELVDVGTEELEARTGTQLQEGLLARGRGGLWPPRWIWRSSVARHEVGERSQGIGRSQWMDLGLRSEMRKCGFVGLLVDCEILMDSRFQFKSKGVFDSMPRLPYQNIGTPVKFMCFLVGLQIIGKPKPVYGLQCYFYTNAWASRWRPSRAPKY
jgi:hypothetical protein